MSVLELCDREIAAVGLEATVADAIHKMLDHHVGAVAVVDSEFRVAGIFTERDVLRKMSLSHVDPKIDSRARAHDHAGRDGHARHGRRGGPEYHAGAALPPSAGG